MCTGSGLTVDATTAVACSGDANTSTGGLIVACRAAACCRLGVRLNGPRPSWTRTDGGEGGSHPSNVHDHTYAIGAVNFTGDMPVILMVDGPSLGGFVCAATIVSTELWKIGQVITTMTVCHMKYGWLAGSLQTNGAACAVCRTVSLTVCRFSGSGQHQLGSLACLACLLPYCGCRLALLEGRIHMHMLLTPAPAVLCCAHFFRSAPMSMCASRRSASRRPSQPSTAQTHLSLHSQPWHAAHSPRSRHSSS